MNYYKHTLLLLTFIFASSVYGQSKNFKVCYKEIHPAPYLASAEQNEKSLMDFVRSFEKAENVEIKEYSSISLDEKGTSFIYLFSLDELEDFQQAKFVYQRSMAIDPEELLSSMMTLNGKKKVKQKYTVSN
jgi:hypothetical protein